MVDAAVSRALSPEPEHRYHSAAELRQALEAALAETENPHPRRRLLVRGLASAVTVALIGVVGIGASRPALRQKAAGALAPMVEKAYALRARASQRLHGAQSAAPAEVPALAMQPLRKSRSPPTKRW